MMGRLFCVVLSVALAASIGGLAAPVSAQPTGILPPGIVLPLGSSLGGGDDALFTVSLPFSFRFPDGSETTSVDISTNGILYPGGTGVIDPTESVAEFTGRVAIAPFWHDLKDFDGAASQVHFVVLSDLAGTPAFAVFTWLNVTVVGGQRPFTLQAILRSSGSIAFRYDNRFAEVNVDGGLIGVSDGSGSAPLVDYSTLSASASLPVSRGAYELFSRPGVVDFGRADEFTGLNFSPNSPFDGYFIGGSIAPIPGVVAGRRACSSTDLGFTISPNGSGYTLQQDGAFDHDFEVGTPYVLDRFEEVPFTSPFPVPMGARLISDWVIRWDGRIVEDAPSGMGLASITPAGADWESVSAPNVWVHEIDAHSFSVTWRGFRQWEFLGPMSTDPPASTFQAVVFASGVIRFAYEELNFMVRLPGGTFFLGVADGRAVAPHEVDFSSGSASTSVPVIFESFNPIENMDPQLDFDRRLNEGWTIEPVSAPRLGSQLIAEARQPDGIRASGLFLLGLPARGIVQPVPLGPADPHLADCQLYVDTVMSSPLVIPAITLPGGTPIAAIPVIPELIGAELSLQGLLLNPGSGPRFLPTDEVLLRFGL